ncbi:MAG TPA: MarR family transcriptional regulator [Thermoanaerobaculia bacterium]|nr:MarR family transcriptional regulator [Thermoanaerobaculia bacterium]
MAGDLQRELKQNKPFTEPAQEAAVALLRTADLVRRTVTVVIEPHDLTLQQYNVLRILRGAGAKGLPTLEIAERMVEQTPGITRLIDRLELKQLVERERSVTDRRQVFVRITKTGLALLAGLDDPVREAEREALGVLSDRQMTQLLSLLDRARNGLHAALESRRAEQALTA